MTVFAGPSNANATTPNAEPQTITLQSLLKLIPLSQYWISEQDTLARRTARYRRYYDGDHDIKLTKEMRAILQSDGTDGSLAINLMPSVVDTKVDRCIVQSIEGVEEDAAKPVTQDETAQQPNAAAQPKEVGSNAPTKWAQEVADLNYFDILQSDVTEATVRDGNGYVMVGWDNEKKQVKMTFEPAWDGQTGMLIVYRSHNIPEPYAAIKVWQIENEAAEAGGLLITTRVNIYYKDKIEKWVSASGSDFVRFVEDGSKAGVYDWTTNDNVTPIGLPVVHFRNAGRENYGVSELRNALSPQDALNRFNYSSIVAAELTAFAVYKALGFEMDSPVITPGVVITMTKPIPKDQYIEFDKLAPSDMTPIIDMMGTTRKLIAEITRTPSPDIAAGSGSNKSGEYLKQLEVGLIGKCKRYMTRAGQAWEQVFDLAWNVQQAFGDVKPPPYKRFFCRWQSPEVRDDAQEVASAVSLDPIWGTRQTLRALPSKYDLNDEKIDKIMQEKKQDAPPVQMALPGMGAPGQPGQPKGAQTQPGDKQPANANITPEQASQWNQMFSEMKKNMSNGRPNAA